MRCWQLDLLGPTDDESRCVLDGVPAGMGFHYSWLCVGKPCAAHVPVPVEMRMSPDREGLGLLHIISTTQSLLLAHREVKECIASHFQGEIEYYNFDLVDPRGRIRSRDYFIVNPIGVFDCINSKASIVKYHENSQKVLDIERLVLDPDKLEKAPCLFRLTEERGGYFITEVLANEFKARGFTGLVLNEIEVEPAR